MIGFNSNRHLLLWFESLFVQAFNPLASSQNAYSNWFGVLGFDAVLRLWDLFVIYGIGILVTASVALVAVYRKHLVKMKPREIELFLCSESNNRHVSTIPAEKYIKKVLSYWDREIR